MNDVSIDTGSLMIRHIPLALAVVLAVGDGSGLLHEEIGARFSVGAHRHQYHRLRISQWPV